MDEASDETRVQLSELEPWQKVELEQEILKDRSEGRSFRRRLTGLASASANTTA